MSAAANFQAHQEEIMAEMQHVQELTMKSETGRKMQEASNNMAKAGKMRDLLDAIGDTTSGEEQMLIMQYLGEILKRDSANGLTIFASYLISSAADPKYINRADYYLAIVDAALTLNTTPEYQEYVEASKIFEDDSDANAVAIREATQVLQAKMKKWAEE